MERLLFVAPWRELDPSVLSNGLHPSKFTSPVREVTSSSDSKRLKSGVCGTAALILTFMRSQRRKAARYPPESTCRPAQDKRAPVSATPPPPPPGRPPLPQAKQKRTSASPAAGMPPRPSKPEAVKPAASTPAGSKAPEVSKTVPPTKSPPAAPAAEATKDLPKPAASTPAGSKAPEVSKTAPTKSPPAAPAAEATKDLPKPAASTPGESKAPEVSKTAPTKSPPAGPAAEDLPKAAGSTSQVNPELEADIANLEKALKEKDAENSVLKQQVEELESYKVQTERTIATKAAAENEKNQFRRPGGVDEKSLADAQKLAGLLGNARKEEDSAQITQLKERLEAAEDKCRIKEAKLLQLQEEKEEDSAEIRDLQETLRSVQEKSKAKESDIFKLQLEQKQALARVKGLEESLQKVKKDAENTEQLKEVLKKIGEITAPFVSDSEDASLLRDRAEGSQRRAAALERENQELVARLRQSEEDLEDLSQVQQTLAASEERAQSLSSSLREIADQVGATGGGLFSLFQQPSEEDLIRDILAEIQKLKS